MDKKKIFEAMQGMTSYEWTNLRMIIDNSFRIQRSEFEDTLKLAEVGTLEKITL